MEDRIKKAKECGFANFPCARFRDNRVWLLLLQMAQDLLAWARRLCLRGEFLEAAPKRLRYQLLHVAGRLVRSARRSTLRLDARWPGAAELAAAFGRLWALPLTPDPTELRPQSPHRDSQALTEILSLPIAAS